MNKKQNFILEYYHIIFVLIAVINIITTVKTESYSNIGRILFILDRCIFNTFLTLLLSKLWRKFVKNNLFDLLASFIISLFVSILFVIFETICGIQMGDVVKTVAIWFIYCFMSYIINYYWMLQLAALPDDPKRDSDISKLIWEIRRERRMEFVYEHTRLLDIKRWKKIEYMDNNKYPDTMYGPWVNFPVDVPAYEKEEYVGLLVVRKADGTEVVYNGSNWNDMVGYFKLMEVKPRDTFDYEKAYLSPVGTQEIQDYVDRQKVLTQTKAWR